MNTSFIVSGKRKGSGKNVVSYELVVAPTAARAAHLSSFTPSQITSIVASSHLSKYGTFYFETQPLTEEKAIANIGQLLESCLPKKQFTVLVFNPGAPEVGDYISNAERSVSVAAMKSATRRIEKISRAMSMPPNVEALFPEDEYVVTLSTFDHETGEMQVIWPEPPEPQSCPWPNADRFNFAGVVSGRVFKQSTGKARHVRHLLRVPAP